MAEKVVLVCDVCGHVAAQSVTFKLGRRSLGQDLCSTHVGELVRNSHAPRRGRKPNVARTPAAAPKRSGRARRGAASGSTGKRATTKISRKRITDPATLQKRRAALEKARRALAKKRAAAKKVG